MCYGDEEVLVCLFVLAGLIKESIAVKGDVTINTESQVFSQFTLCCKCESPFSYARSLRRSAAERLLQRHCRSVYQLVCRLSRF